MQQPSKCLGLRSIISSHGDGGDDNVNVYDENKPVYKSLAITDVLQSIAVMEGATLHPNRKEI